MADDAILQAALEYAAAGFEVFPLSGKASPPKDWPNLATNNEEGVIKLFEQFPDLENVAIKCGPGSKLVDFNVNKPGGEKLLCELFGGTIPITPKYLARRGGHWAFAWRIGFPQKARYFLGENDELEVIPGNGAAYTLAPPSIADGVTRQWATGLSPSECPLAEVPDEVMIRLISKEPVLAGGNGGPADSGGELCEGARNTQLTSIAGSYRRIGWDPNRIFGALTSINDGRCVPPLDVAEVLAISRSMAKYEPEDMDPEEDELNGAEPQTVQELIQNLRKAMKLPGLRGIVQILEELEEVYEFHIKHGDAIQVVSMGNTTAIFDPDAVRRRISARMKIRTRRYTKKPWEKYAHRIIQAALVVSCDTRMAIVAGRILDYLENARNLKEGQDPDTRGNPCRFPNGDIAFSGQSINEGLGRSVHRITSSEISRVLKEAGRKERRTVGDRKRFYVVSPEGLDAVRMMRHWK